MEACSIALKPKTDIVEPIPLQLTMTGYLLDNAKVLLLIYIFLS